MWQRLQTLFLAIATGLVVSLYWCDAASLIAPDGTEQGIAYTSKPVYLTWIIILTVLQVLSLGGFKWRMKQFRVTLVTAFMCLGFQGWLVYDYIMLHNELLFSVTALFPFVASVMDFLAVKNILLDEALVINANRLRRSRKK